MQKPPSKYQYLIDADYGVTFEKYFVSYAKAFRFQENVIGAAYRNGFKVKTTRTKSDKYPYNQVVRYTKVRRNE